MGWPDRRWPIESGRGDQSAITTAKRAGARPCPYDGPVYGHGPCGRPDETVIKQITPIVERHCSTMGVILTRKCYVEGLTIAQSRIERVAQAVAQEVEGQYDQSDRDGRGQQQPGLSVNRGLAIQEHRAPAGDEDVLRVGRRA